MSARALGVLAVCAAVCSNAITRVAGLPARPSLGLALISLALAALGVGLTRIPPRRLSIGALELALLLANTALLAMLFVVKSGAGDRDIDFGFALVWITPYAFAILPLTRCLRQVVYVAAGYTAVLAGLAAVPTGLTSRVAISKVGFLVLTLIGTGLLVRVLAGTLWRRTSSAEAVADLGRKALTGLPVPHLLHESLLLCRNQLGVECGAVVAATGEGGDTQVIADVGRPGGETGGMDGPSPLPTCHPPLGAGDLAGEAIRARRPLQRQTADGEGSRGAGMAHPKRWTLAVPIERREPPREALLLCSRPHPYSRQDRSFAGSVANVLGTALDHTAEDQRRAHQAMHDWLTGLPNRMLFLDRLAHALSRRTAVSQAGPVVLMLDLDGFKDINDTLGHAAGDELLVELGRRLVRTLRPEDTVARLGGDEFVVLCERVPTVETALMLARRLSVAWQEPFSVRGPASRTGLRVTGSVGVAPAGVRLSVSGPSSAGDAGRPGPVQAPDELAEVLLREADAAMYRAKERGPGGVAVFDELLRVRAQARLRREGELRRALDEGEFVVHYQPVVNIDTGMLVEVEALVRWRHPERGILLPAEFIPLAEESGVVGDIGRFVLERSCRDVAQWQREGLGPDGQAPLGLAVNVSPRQLDDPDLPELIQGIDRRFGLAPRTLALEITETALLEVGAAAEVVLDRLTRSGARLVLDDFGTGYSSLTHLARIPVEAIKIDRSFVRNLGTPNRDEDIVAALITLSRQLGLYVVAEGVESGEQLRLLRTMGCDRAQGFHLGAPEPAVSTRRTLATARCRLDRRPRHSGDPGPDPGP